MNVKKNQIAIFASGTGTNAAKIIAYFKEHELIKVALIVCNKPDAGVLTVAKNNGIPTLIIRKEQFFQGDAYLSDLKTNNIKWIILAGFLWKLPPVLIEHYRNHIINIHPALLPKYGGKGMYGVHVHEAVLAAGEQSSGITIHYVDEHYDHGDVIFQTECDIDPNETPQSLASKVHQLEHQYYPVVIEQEIEKDNWGGGGC